MNVSIIKATLQDATEIALLALKLWPEHTLEELVEEFQEISTVNWTMRPAWRFICGWDLWRPIGSSVLLRHCE